MNDRIKELAEQCTTIYNSTTFPVDKDFDHEKFADLIVEECITRIETHEIPLGNSAAGEIACEMTYMALKQIRDEIREHFGVK